MAQQAFAWLLIVGGLDALLVKPLGPEGAAPWHVHLIGGLLFIALGAVGLRTPWRRAC